jgi:NEDD4-binding protein 2
MEVIILRGISGSGKSTWVKNFRESNPDAKIEVASADDFFVGCKTGEYKFDPSKLNEAHATCFEYFETLLRNRKPWAVEKCDYIIVDNTNTQLWEMSPYIALANLHNVPVRIIRMVCPEDVAATRNVHGVPLKAIQSMNGRMQTLLPFWPKEEYVYST